MELGAGTYCAFDPEAAAVGFYDVLGDGEAEASAADFAGASCVHAIEAVSYTHLDVYKRQDF